MSQLDQILDVLTGEKRFDGAKWVSYDAAGAPLTDAGGVLWRGLHGWLLYNEAIGQAEDVSVYGGGGRREDDAKLVRDHWEYMDELRLAKTVSIQVADDVLGARTIELPLDMPVPVAMLPAGSPAKTVGDALGNPLLLAALVIAIDEAD